MPRLLALLLCLAPCLALTGCDYPPTDDKPRSVSDLGIATPQHSVSDPSKLYAMGPATVPVPSPAVPRATDAGGQDEGRVIEPRE